MFQPLCDEINKERQMEKERIRSLSPLLGMKVRKPVVINRINPADFFRDIRFGIEIGLNGTTTVGSNCLVLVKVVFLSGHDAKTRGYLIELVFGEFGLDDQCDRR